MRKLHVCTAIERWSNDWKVCVCVSVCVCVWVSVCVCGCVCVWVCVSVWQGFSVCEVAYLGKGVVVLQWVQLELYQDQLNEKEKH